MAYHTIIKTEPSAFYPLDSSPYIDRSENRLANLTLTNYIHELWGFNYGKLAVCPPTFTVPAPIDNPNLWTLGLNVKVLSETSDIVEFTGSGGTGVTYSSGLITVALVHENATETIMLYPHKFTKVSDLFVVVDSQSVMLYIDGLMVSSKEIIADSPVVIGDTLTVGTATGSVAVGGIVVWSRPLSSRSVSAISKAYRRYPYRRQLSDITESATFTPEILSMNRKVSDIRVVDEGSAVNLSNGSYISDVDGVGMSAASSFMCGYFVQEESHGVALYWDDDYLANVEGSIDGGQSWLAIQNGVLIDGTYQPTEGFAILFRVSFPAGSVVRPYIHGLRVVEYTENQIEPLGYTNRLSSFSGSLYIPETAHHPQIHGDGMRLLTDSIVEFAPDANEFPVNVAAVEFVYGPTPEDLTGTNYILNSSPEHSSNISVIAGKLNFSGFSSVYVNGVSTASNATTLRAGINYQILANYTTPNNLKITIGMENSSVEGPISTINLHPVSFTAQEAADEFNKYLRYPLFSATAEGSLTIGDSEVSIYVKDWTARGS